jgi:hypothetical protein
VLFLLQTGGERVLALGVDLAQARDKTAMVAVESWRPEVEPTMEEMVALANMDPIGTLRRKRPRVPRPEVHHQITHIAQLRPGVSYPEQAMWIIQAAHALSYEERATVYVDATGVGRAVVDLLRRDCPFPIVAVTITPGGAVTKKGKDWSVAKTELISALEVVLSTRRLSADPGVDNAGLLLKQLKAFGYVLGETGRPKFEGKGSHDDITMALALAIFAGERGGSSVSVFQSFMDGEIRRRNVEAPY